MILLLPPFVLLLPPPLPSSSSSGMRNLDGWMTGRMTIFSNSKKKSPKISILKK
jgi:hypothetical protein